MTDASTLTYAELQAAYNNLMAETMALRRSQKPPADARAASWRVRVRLYDTRIGAEPQADSDPDLPANAPGETVIPGLPGVAEHLAILAAQFHGGPCGGLDPDTLRHRLKSLRPTLSRNGGKAQWRVPYVAPLPGNWLAVVTVQREDKA